MKLRSVTTLFGHTFRVPANIQRIDVRGTHGWQVRCNGTRLFSDGAKSRAAAGAALQAAIAELRRRMAAAPVPTRLGATVPEGRARALPVGIHGPVIRTYPAGSRRSPTASYQVSVPVFGRTARRITVYIGTVNTCDAHREKAALARAIEIRDAGAEAYRKAEAAARRAMREALRIPPATPAGASGTMR